MTQEQIKDAIEQMKVSCDLAMPNYHSMSARSCLHSLGYHGEDCEQVLQAIADGGFRYCLDPKISCSNEEYPDYSVCVWGPDQLKSRLRSVYIP